MESSFRYRRVLRAAALTVAMAVACLVGGPASAGVIQEGTCGAKLAAGTATPVGIQGCSGVRPGGYVEAPQGWCTLNFLFSVAEPTADGHRTVRYIATAGHCALEDVGERTWGYNEGPKAFNASGAKIGEFIYAVLDYDGTVIGPYRDFGLIRLDPDVTSRPRVCHFGGPTGTNNDLIDEPVVIHHYGQGIGFGASSLDEDLPSLPSTVPARSSVARLNDPDVAGGFGTINYGDSGSPAITEDGRAVGVIVQFFEETGPGSFGMTRLRPQVLRAERVLDVDMTLLTAALK